jgi:hypothetical protein
MAAAALKVQPHRPHAPTDDRAEPGLLSQLVLCLLQLRLVHVWDAIIASILRKLKISFLVRVKWKTGWFAGEQLRCDLQLQIGWHDV